MRDTAHLHGAPYVRGGMPARMSKWVSRGTLGLARVISARHRIAVRLDKYFKFLGRAIAAVTVTVTLSDFACYHGNSIDAAQVIGDPELSQTRILPSRGVLGVSLGAHGLFCQFHQVRVLVGEADTATRGPALRPALSR